MIREIRNCFECEGDYFADTSEMEHLCPDCSHFLYGLINCEHVFKNGRCSNCYWDGKNSDYVRTLKEESAER